MPVSFNENIGVKTTDELDNIESIEEEISHAAGPEPTVVPDTIIDKNTTPAIKIRPPRKQELIPKVAALYPNMSNREITRMRVNDLIDLVKKADGEIPAYTKLQKDTARLFPGMKPEDMPKDPEECKRLLGKTMQSHMENISGISKEDGDDIKATNKELKIDGNTDNISRSEPSPDRVSRKAKTLFNYHLAVGGVLECVTETESIQARTGSNLAGLSKDLIDKKEEMLEILSDLYTDYSEELDPYLNALMVYGTFMGGVMTHRWLDNKKKISNGESVKSPLRLEELLRLESQLQQRQSAAS